MLVLAAALLLAPVALPTISPIPSPTASPRNAILEVINRGGPGAPSYDFAVDYDPVSEKYVVYYPFKPTFVVQSTNQNPPAAIPYTDVYALGKFVQSNSNAISATLGSAKATCPPNVVYKSNLRLIFDGSFFSDGEQLPNLYCYKQPDIVTLVSEINAVVKDLGLAPRAFPTTPPPRPLH